MSEVFIMTIWPFAEGRLSEICDMINKKHKLLSLSKFPFSISWQDMIKKVYTDDKIKEYKLIPKVECLSSYPKYVYIAYISVDDPKYYTKPDGRIISGSMAELKKEIRAKFGPKREADKNPLHIPDNEEHSNNYQRILEELKCF